MVHVAIIYGYADTEKRFLDKLPKQVNSLDDIDRVHQEMQGEFDSIEDKGLGNKFSRWRKKRQINKIVDNKDSPLHHGARGELKVLDKFAELDDNYHVMCGLNIGLPNWVTYKGKKNLRSAQMDFVVACTKGVFMIEVKNWSKSYSQNYDGFSPYEQTDRAGMVLWIHLKSWRFSPRVTNVLLSTQGSFEYNRNYKAVFVSSLDRITNFIQGRQEVLSEKDVNKVVGKLKRYVTK